MLIFHSQREIQEVRTAISQNSTTLALLEKAFHPGTYTVANETDSGRACMWRNFQLKTPHRLPADSEEETKTLENKLESNHVVISAQD